MHDASPAGLRHQEGEQRPKADFRDLQEVARPHVIGMVAEEGCPGLTLRARWSCLSHIPLDRPLRDVDIKLQ